MTIERLSKLERSGYGIPRTKCNGVHGSPEAIIECKVCVEFLDSMDYPEAPMTAREYVHEGGRFALGALAIIIWAVAIIII